MSLSFDELLDLAARKGPHEFEVRALGGKKVYIRDPSSADVDAWRMHCSRHQSGDSPLAAKLVQLLLCDEEGERIVPQTEEALAKLADGDPKAIDEIAKLCLPLVQEPSEDDLENEKKD
jgi:hypothetical protein